jgi:hypothetical protein
MRPNFLAAALGTDRSDRGLRNPNIRQEAVDICVDSRYRAWRRYIQPGLISGGRSVDRLDVVNESRPWYRPAQPLSYLTGLTSQEH